jgi:serine/threonine protein kinase
MKEIVERREEVARLFDAVSAETPESVRARADELVIRYLAEEGVLPLAPGDVVGPYELLEVLGAGGQAVVYLARHRHLGREVALKIPRREVTERLLREAKLSARLEHPSIVRVEDVFPEGPVPYMVMEYCPGGSLEALLEGRTEGLPLNRLCEIARKILQVLVFAHKRSVIHRDLKPANILFDREGHLKVGDFGIGTLATVGDLEHSLDVSHATRLAGTPLYMAPEQENPALRVNGKLDGRADLFAFGKVLFQMLTGASPRTIRPPTRLRKGLDPAWDEYIFRLTEEHPEDRFTGAQEALFAFPLLGPEPGRQDEIPAIEGTKPEERKAKATEPVVIEREGTIRSGGDDRIPPSGAPPRLSVGRAFREGIHLYGSGFFGIIFVASLIASLFTSLSVGILGGLLFGGLYIILLRVLDGKPVKLGDILAPADRFGPLLGAFLLLALGGLVGLALGFVPGMFFGAFFSYVIPLIAERRMTFRDSWSRSFRAVCDGGIAAHVLLWSLTFLLCLPELAGSLVPGVGTIAGALISAVLAPLTTGVWASAYRQVILRRPER